MGRIPPRHSTGTFSIIWSVKKATIDLVVVRKNDDGVCVMFPQGLGKRPCHIGESSGFGEGHNFRREQGYAHTGKDEGGIKTRMKAEG